MQLQTRLSHSFALVCLLSTSTLPLVAQEVPYILSKRIGATITLEDQAYFGLFPDVTNFVSAAVYEGARTDIEVHITTRAQPIVETLSAATAAELGKYLDGFERYVLENDFQSLNWLLIRHLVNRTKPYEAGKNLRITLHNGQSHTGRLLYADDNHILLTQAPELLAYPDPTYVSAVRSQEIATIGSQREEVKQVRSFLATLFPPLPRVEKADTPPVEGDEAQGLPLLSTLHEDMALEPPRIPPEIRQLLAQLAQEAPIATESSQRRTEETIAAYTVPHDRFHLFVPWVPVSTSSSSSTTILSTGDQGVLQAPVDRETSFLAPDLYLEAEYAFSGHLRLGINYQRHEEVPALTFGNGNFAVASASEYLSGSAWGLFVTYILNPIHKNKRFKVVAPELSLRLGGTYAQLETVSSMAIVNNVQVFTDEHTTVGGLAQVGLDLYFTRRFSLAAVFQVRAYPNLELAEQATSRYNQFNSYTYSYAEGRTYTALQTNVLAGFRVHL